MLKNNFFYNNYFTGGTDTSAEAMDYTDSLTAVKHFIYLDCRHSKVLYTQGRSDAFNGSVTS